MKRSFTFFPIVFFTLFFFSFIQLAFSQEGFEHFSPIAHGAGRTYSLTSHGLSAIGLNPAELQNDRFEKYPYPPVWEFNVIPLSAFGLDAGPSFIDAASLSTVFKPTGGTISDEDRKKISNLLLDEKLSGRADVQILAVSYAPNRDNTIAFSWTTHAAVRTDIPPTFLNFFVHAESQLAQYSGSYSNFDFQGMWYSEYGVTFAHQFDLFSYPADRESSTLMPLGSFTTLIPGSYSTYFKVGGAIKYVSGIGYIGLDQDNNFANKASSGRALIDVNYKIRSAYSNNFDPNKLPTSFSFGFLTSEQAGSGLGVDLGASYELTDRNNAGALLTVAASVTDIGFISWSANATQRVADHIHDTIVYDNVIGDIKHLNDSLKVLSGVLTHLESFTTPLPTMLRVGAKLNLHRADLYFPFFADSYLAFEFADGLNSVVGSLNHPRVGLGYTAEHHDKTASLRVAAGFFIQSGQSDITLGLGTTLFNHVSIDIATAHFLQFFNAGTGRTDIAFAIRGQL